MCGSGGFADSCRAWNLFILNAMETALQRGIPVVMFGQGMGPLSDADVLARAREVLPRVTLITLRGSRGGASLLQALGVAPAKVLTTGDEATELAYITAGAPGTEIGINLRVAAYSPVSGDAVAMVGRIVREFAHQKGVSLLPVPIAFHDCANDRDTIRQLLPESDRVSAGDDFLDSPAMLIDQVARCRILVTGAYHAAVFALGQGIPIVCLASSEYYVAKFQGLEDLYETGCTIVQLDQPNAGENSQTLWSTRGIRPIRFERRSFVQPDGRSNRAARHIGKFASCWNLQQPTYRRKHTLCTELKLEARGLRR